MAIENGFVLLAGSANPELAREIGCHLDHKVFEFTSWFSNREVNVEIPEVVRRKQVFIIQSTAAPNVDSHIIELFAAIDAARRGDATEISVVMPHFGYARQDRKDKPRVPITSAMIAGIIEHLGVRRLLTMDIHSEQQQGFFSRAWDNLYGSACLISAILARGLDNIVVAAPDQGGFKKAVAYADRLCADGVASVFKIRDIHRMNHSKALEMIGDVKNKNVLIIDDMIDTGGTIINAAELLLNRGAQIVWAAATHGVLSGSAIERLSQSPIDQIFITNTIAQPAEVTENPKFTVVSVAELFAEAIGRIYKGESLSDVHSLIN